MPKGRKQVVVPLFKQAERTKRPDQSVLELCRQMLDAAQRGELASVGVAAVMGNGRKVSHFASSDDSDGPDLLAATDLLHAKVLAAVVQNDE